MCAPTPQLCCVSETSERSRRTRDLQSNEKGTHWVHGDNYDAVTETYATEIFLRLRDGYVTLVSVNAP